MIDGCPAHLRVCGEHLLSHTIVVAHCGSSPRVRGTPTRSRCAHTTRRFIPACAGNTPAEFCASARLAVHPRVCGEHNATAVGTNIADGSSPRVRGTRGYALARNGGMRFIPACAGNTLEPDGRQFRESVHPRVCGEHTINARFFSGPSGSSPRVRGTHFDERRRLMQWRFIPACAGNTHEIRASRVPQSVHPRVCGEHYPEQRDAVAEGGSSPRVRGTRRGVIARRGGSRFIPACAGNTVYVA